MKKNLFNLMAESLVMVLLFCLAACDSRVLWEDDLYEVHWIDIKSNITLNRKVVDGVTIGRVDAKIISVGSNNFYVVAKKVDPKTGEISYFYVDKEKDNNYLNQEEITQGPFSESKYMELKSELNLPELSKVFK
ncbi:MAG TPA: hypothetical protein VN030_11645 [Cellvibrio sp.]|nr:hypothetical protein [Cellvibrio sp.]